MKNFLPFWYLIVSQQTIWAWFETCDRNISITTNDSIQISSPYYPYKYSSGSSCRNVITAAFDYELHVQCKINTDKSFDYETRKFYCDTEFFYVSTENDRALKNSEYFCGSYFVQRVSVFSTVVIAYISKSAPLSGSGGSFQCNVTSRPKSCDCGWSLSTKIVGGTEANINEFPFMAGLVNILIKHIICGGSIITNQFVLTAAHCLENKISDLGIVVGDHDILTGTETIYTKFYKIQSATLHEDYSRRDDINDIGLVQVNGVFEWSIGVGPACLPFADPYNSFENDRVQIVGWGHTAFDGRSSAVLMKADTRIISNSLCGQIARSTNVSAATLCTYEQGRDSCQEDSGGPVVLNSNRRLFLVGVISAGFACPYVGSNTRITSYLNWIQSNTMANFCSKTLF